MKRRRCPGNLTVWQLAAVGCLCGVAGAAATACKAAPNPTGPVRLGPDTLPPFLELSPSRDTVVDSTGVLLITVSAHDQALIDSIAILAQNAPSTFQTVFPQDTAALVYWTVALGALQHRAFTFQVATGDVLGHDTVTQAIKVTPR